MNSLASTANSLLFFRCYRVSKRLSDVPELSEIVKQFTTKYGKDFATSAIELRPDSGVSRLLICFILVPLTVLDLTRYVDMISNPEVAYVLRKRQAPEVMNEMSEDLKPNTVYKLNGFSIRPSKSVYRVSPHKHGISFNNKTTFAPVHEVDYQIDSQHFHIRDLQAFTDIVDKHRSSRLIHCWEARNFKRLNILMGVELLLIDSKSTTIQGFISTHFLPRFKEDLKPNTVYKLNGFSIRPSKSVYRVSPHKHGISFNNKTTFAPVHEVDYQIDSQHFHIRDLQAFTDIVDKHRSSR
ncbi:hypothetical protein Bca52824_087455 [Brassica carinata]|uniref:Replication protein A 70 kDa DNA-binding subunit B/D first OB fold domain-containing protein n=1 Tax=Brassica carinata TaxID=52824 RepID=A0A8X7PC10_BRACI|nr:hypothetical protein Bca52824_087455 [Brassica carinata]